MFGFFWSWWVVGGGVRGGGGDGWIGEGGLRAARKDDEGLGEVMWWGRGEGFGRIGLSQKVKLLKWVKRITGLL